MTELDFLIKLQRIFNEGLFVASYKVRAAPRAARARVEKEAAP